MALVSKNFSDIVTFTRASAAWAYNSSGVLTQYSSNQPRLDFDPVTLAARGLLIEEQRTRINTISLAPSAPENVTVTAQAYTISFFGTGSVALSGAYTGTVTGTGAAPTRTTLTFTPSAGSLTLTPSGTVQDLQVEAGSFATSVMRGEGSQVTRAADVATINALSPWFNAAGGTLYVEASDIPNTTSGTTYGLFSLSDGTGNNRIQLRKSATAASGTTLVVTGGVSQYSDVLGTWANSATHKFAMRFAANDFMACIDGTLGVADTSGTLPTVTQAEIGNGSSIGYACGHIRKIAFYPSGYTNAQLQSLTA